MILILIPLLDKTQYRVFSQRKSNSILILLKKSLDEKCKKIVFV
jgi:hypothetical protein